MKPKRHHNPNPDNELPLGRALGPRFKVYLPYRARRVRVLCRRCLDGWWLPRSEAFTPAFGLIYRGHRCSLAHQSTTSRKQRCPRCRSTRLTSELVPGTSKPKLATSCVKCGTLLAWD